jgi:hypothetical protein
MMRRRHSREGHRVLDSREHHLGRVEQVLDGLRLTDKTQKVWCLCKGTYYICLEAKKQKTARN